MIAWTSVGVLLGALLASVVDYQQFQARDWLIIAFSLSFVGFFRRTIPAICMVLFAGTALGLSAGIHSLQNLDPLTQLSGTTQTVTGRVSDDTTRGPSGDQRIQLTDISIDGQKLNGAIWINAFEQADIKRGDIVTAEGTIRDGFGTMQASMFRADVQDIVRPEPGDIARVARDNFSQKISEFIASPQANLGVSFLVGQRSNLPADIQEMFRDLGLVHLVVASGFHLTIVIRFSRKLLAPWSKYLALSGSLMLIFGFLLLTGFSTSMTRASLVAGLSLLAWFVGRSIHPLILLPVVAAITVLINPLYIWADMAWYLSFAAFTGVIIYAPLIQKYFWPADKEPGWLRYIVVATLSAQLLTFPIIALTFEQYSPLAIIANVLVLPIVPLVMLGTFATGAIGYILPWLGTIFGWFTELGLRYITTVVDYLALLPWATRPITMSPIQIALFYVVLFGLAVYATRVTKHSLRTENPIE